MVSIDRDSEMNRSAGSDFGECCVSSQFSSFLPSHELAMLPEARRNFMRSLSRKMVRGVSSWMRACLWVITCRSGIVFNSQLRRRWVPSYEVDVLSSWRRERFPMMSRSISKGWSVWRSCEEAGGMLFQSSLMRAMSVSFICSQILWRFRLLSILRW